MGGFPMCSDREDCCAVGHACAGPITHWALPYAAAGEGQS